MTKKATTKDELFMLKLHELASKKGDPYAEIDQFVIGQAIGQNDRGVTNIVKHLAQANFIKKGEGSRVYLTEHGMWLVLTLSS